MQTLDTGLRAAIRKASAIVRETSTTSEAAALEFVDRTEAALAEAQATLKVAKEFGENVAQCLGHAARTTVGGVIEFKDALGRFGKDAFVDTVEVSRESFAATGVKQLVDLLVDYVSRRSHAVFTSIDELNSIAKAKTFAAWSPMGETLHAASEKATA